MNDLSNYSDKDLINEIQKREREKLKPLPIKFKSPIGKWIVTTEGDVEGRTIRDLGVYEGHIADIAFKLGGESYYSLHFSSFVTKPTSKMKSSSQVSIVLDISSGTWDMNNEERAIAVDAFLHSEPSGRSFKVTENNYYASSLLKEQKR